MNNYILFSILVTFCSTVVALFIRWSKWYIMFAVLDSQTDAFMKNHTCAESNLKCPNIADYIELPVFAYSLKFID